MSLKTPEGKEIGPTKLNVVKHRGDPTYATTLSGHHVEKKLSVIVPNPMTGEMIALRCADYHMEHFVYIDPMFDKKLPKDSPSYWWAMCTCGAKAQMVGPGDAAKHNGEEFDGTQEAMLVCEHYFMTLMEGGFGYHQGQDARRWA